MESDYQNSLDSISKKYENELEDFKSSLEKKEQHKKDFSILLEKLLLN